MSKQFEVLFYGDVINCVRDENGKEYKGIIKTKRQQVGGRIGATYSQKYKHILKEFVDYCNERPRTSRADHLESLMISFLHGKMERYN